MRIEHFLTTSADRIGSEPAVVAGGRSYSYNQLARGAGRIAVALGERGVLRGERVGVLMDTTPAAVAVIFGIMMAGAVVCVADRTTDAEGLAAFLVEHRPAALAVDAKFAPLAAEVLAGIADVRLVLLNGPGAPAAGANCLSVGELIARLGPAHALPAAGTADDTAMVLGKLGAREDVRRPVSLSHGELAAGAESTAPRQGVVLRSIFTFAGFCHLAQAIRTGVTVVLEAPFEPRRRSARMLLPDQDVFIPVLDSV